MPQSYVLNAIGVDSDRDLQAWTLRDREYYFTVTSNGGSRTIGGSTAGEMPLRISFNVERTDGTALNLARIKIWNLSKATVNMLSQHGAKVKLRAGYSSGNGIPVIFEGTVVQMVETLSGADRICTIEAVDGFQELTVSIISLAFKAKTTFYHIFRSIAYVMGVPLSMSKTALTKASSDRLKWGASIYGKASAVLSESLFSAYVWRFEAGTLYIKLETDKQNAKAAYALTPLTGLIGMPQRLYESSVTQNDNITDAPLYTIYGYRVEFFMNGAIQINDAVYLESREVSGLFTVYKMTITGDNLGGDWICTAELKEYSA